MTSRVAPPQLGRRPVMTPRAMRGLRGPVFWSTLAPALAAWAALFWAREDGHIAHIHICGTPASGLGLSLTSWSVMILAMMFPTLVPPAGHVAARSFRQRRAAHVALFALGFVLVWIAAYGPAYVLGGVVSAGLGAIGAEGWITTFGLLAAAAWQLSPPKRRAGWACHLRPPLAATGRAALWDVARYGVAHGWRCLRSCFALMVPPMLGTHSLFLMAVLTALILSERAADRPDYRASAAILIGLAAITPFAAL